jgi:hypothetical protein
MIIDSAQYMNNLGVTAVNIKITTNGEELFVPLDPANRHYAEILLQVAAGTLTIAAAS